MLVLARTVGEKIIITSPEGVILTLTIVEVRGDKTRVGIDAPREWSVHRKEIADAIALEKI